MISRARARAGRAIVLPPTRGRAPGACSAAPEASLAPAEPWQARFWGCARRQASAPSAAPAAHTLAARLGWPSSGNGDGSGGGDAKEGAEARGPPSGQLDFVPIKPAAEEELAGERAAVR